MPLQDGAQFDGEKTLKLTLSKASGGNAYLSETEAVGTIENHDAMPRAWLARFGRTVAEQVIDAVDTQLSASRSAGIEVRIAGQAFGNGVMDEEMAALEDAEKKTQLEALASWLKGETDDVHGLDSSTREHTGGTSHRDGVHADRGDA